MTDNQISNDSDKIELWGGPECTICRIGDKWRDQSQATGHDERPADLDLIAELGIRTVRYPILWEKAAADCSSPLDFSWADRQLDRLRTLGIDVIGGPDAPRIRAPRHRPSGRGIPKLSSRTMRPRSPSAIRGSTSGRPSTNRSPRRAFRPSTGIGIRTGRISPPSPGRSSTNVSVRCGRWQQSAASSRPPLSSRRRISSDVRDAATPGPGRP
jgi:hypothetical protein